MTTELTDVQAPGEPPRVCEHGIRWPWACEDCDNAWEAARPQAEARPSEAMDRLRICADTPRFGGKLDDYPEQLADLRALLAENDEIRDANFRWVAKCQAMFAAKEAAESKLSVLAATLSRLEQALTVGVGRPADVAMDAKMVEALRCELTEALVSLQSPQEPAT